jgi:hypothetical protein
MKAKIHGQDTCFLFHVEAESGPTTQFPKRLFHYYAKITLTYDLPVYPIALFTYDSPKRAEPDVYEVSFPDQTVLKFQYKVIQLNRLSWRDFINKRNPAACALMAKMNIAPKDRPKVKSECMRILMSLKLDPARTRLIGVFIDTYLKLNAEEMKEFHREMGDWPKEERNEAMELMTSWEEKGMERGLQKGKEELLSLMIEQRFSTLPAAITAGLDRLTSEQLNELGKALLGFNSLADLEEWLARH